MSHEGLKLIGNLIDAIEERCQSLQGYQVIRLKDIIFEKESLKLFIEQQKNNNGK